MNTQDQIVEFLKVIGPTLPAKVAKNIKSEIIIASAYLSDLAAQGLVKISSLKVGGSPLYYLPGQEAQLYPFAAGNINPKDLQVLERLKGEKVLQEAHLDLLSKVALRSLRDFAVPLHVYIDGKRQLFWKWHLLPPESTNDAIAEVLRRNELFIKPKPAEIENENTLSPEQKETENVTEKTAEPAAVVESHKPTAKAVPVVPETAAEKSQAHDEVQQKLNHKKQEKREKKAVPVEEKASAVKKERQILSEEEKTVAAKTEKLEKLVAAVKIEEPKMVTKVKAKTSADTFFPAIDVLFKTLEITIDKKEIIRKNAELNFMVDVPSVVGKMRYFCKAKQKVKCDEKDLSAAYVEAQMKKLPLLFLYSHQLTKKAQVMVHSGVFENLIVRKIE